MLPSSGVASRIEGLLSSWGVACGQGERALLHLDGDLEVVGVQGRRVLEEARRDGAQEVSQVLGASIFIPEDGKRPQLQGMRASHA